MDERYNSVKAPNFTINFFLGIENDTEKKLQYFCASLLNGEQRHGPKNNESYLFPKV